MFECPTVSHRQPVRVTDLAQYPCIIDARTPAEFALDHIPGAINCPVLSDEERVIVGTTYKQVSPFEAKRMGAAMVAANLAHHLRETIHDKPANWKPLVYCWRGGLRSGSMVTWLRLVGWDAQQLAGGYKAYRGHVVEQLEQLIPQMQLRVLCGATGSAKTRLLHALAAQGEQIVDLEGLACHKGSLLGQIPNQDQPSQKHFDTLLYAQIAQLDLSRPVYLEGESPKIGRVALPLSMVKHMRESMVIEIQATTDARLEYLLRDYAYLGDNPERLAHKLSFLTELQGKERITRWQEWALAGELPALFRELMTLHYDPQYARSQSNHFTQWPTRSSIAIDDLTEANMAALAQRIQHQPG